MANVITFLYSFSIKRFYNHLSLVTLLGQTVLYTNIQFESKTENGFNFFLQIRVKGRLITAESINIYNYKILHATIYVKMPTAIFFFHGKTKPRGGRGTMVAILAGNSGIGAHV